MLVKILTTSLTSVQGGLAAVFAAAAHAPITEILILFEITLDYRIIRPLMIATVIATALSRYLSMANIYTTKLLRRGIDIGMGRDATERRYTN